MALKCKTVLCYTPALVEEPNSFHFGAEGVRRPEQQVLQRGASAEEEAEALAAPRGSAAAERLSDTGEATRPVCPGGWME